MHPREFWWLYEAKTPPDLLMGPDAKWAEIDELLEDWNKRHNKG